MVDSLEIYYEPQKAAFCGVHAVNNLLQGPLYSEWDFSQVALALTEEERKLMAERGTESKDYLVFMAKDSTHVDESGNFSIEVIKKAITNMGLTITPLTHPAMKDAKKDPHKEIAFICNLANHWLTIRKIAGTWYNLNSVLPNGPHSISDLYLGAFLQQLAVDKYSIFVIRGRLPDPLQEKGNGMRIPIKKITNKGTEGMIKKKKTEPSSGSNDTDLARAIALSNASKEEQQVLAQSAAAAEQEAIMKAIQLSMADDKKRQDGNRLGGDDDLQRALKLSMQQ